MLPLTVLNLMYPNFLGSKEKHMDHQSFAELLGNYGEFVGAIGVVASLVYLGIQIKQNTIATERSNARQIGVENS